MHGDGPDAPQRLIRPKDAATLIVYRRDRDGVRVLMGRRAPGHVFMPNALVFPGGRLDRSDYLAPACDDLDPVVRKRLLSAGGVKQDSKARALALTAIRETYEETGYLVGRAGDMGATAKSPAWSAMLAHGVTPQLSNIRLVYRAITPPGPKRRFDARFFAVNAEAIAGQVPPPEDELGAPAWLTIEEARAGGLARVTLRVMARLEQQLALYPELLPDLPIIFRRQIGKHFVEDEV